FVCSCDSHVPPPRLHAFPTRRSSDLANPQALLTVSGYAGPDARPHAGVMQEIAISMGVDAERIRAFPQARDTAEEAALLAPLLQDRKSTRLNSSHVKISYAVFCLKKK